jgi:hypothetical protein
METVFYVGPLRGYITRISGQLESELRKSLETAVEDDWEEMVTSSVEDFMCAVVTVSLL